MPHLFSIVTRFTLTALAACTMVGSSVSFGETEAELQRKIERLEKQNATLRNSYSQAQKDAAQAADQLAELKKRMEALGAGTVSGNEERLLQAIADIEVLNERTRKLEEAAVRLSGVIIAYMKQAVTEDPQSRANVEAKLRDLDQVLGLRQQPINEERSSLADARIVSIDSESGLLVINVGTSEGLRTGTPLKVTRGEQIIGEAIVSDVRKNIAGALIQKLESPSELVRVGDSAAVITTDQ